MSYVCPECGVNLRGRYCNRNHPMKRGRAPTLLEMVAQEVERRKRASFRERIREAELAVANQDYRGYLLRRGRLGEVVRDALALGLVDKEAAEPLVKQAHPSEPEGER